MMLMARSRKQFHHLFLIADTLQYEVFGHQVASPVLFIPPPGRAIHQPIPPSGLDPLIQQSQYARPPAFIPPSGHVSVEWFDRSITEAIVWPQITAKTHEVPPVRAMAWHSPLGITGDQPVIHQGQFVRPSQVPPPDAMRGRAIYGHNFLTGDQPVIQPNRFDRPPQFIPPSGKAILEWVDLSIPEAAVIDILTHRWAKTHAIPPDFLRARGYFTPRYFPVGYGTLPSPPAIQITSQITRSDVVTSSITRSEIITSSITRSDAVTSRIK